MQSEDVAGVYLVLINAEEQYSLWDADIPIPAGWTSVGKPGTREECVAHIDQVWTDMRPASLRATRG